MENTTALYELAEAISKMLALQDADNGNFSSMDLRDAKERIESWASEYDVSDYPKINMIKAYRADIAKRFESHIERMSPEQSLAILHGLRLGDLTLWNLAELVKKVMEHNPGAVLRNI